MKKFSLIVGAAALATIGGVFAAWTAFDSTQIETESNVKINASLSTKEINVLGNAKLTLRAANDPSFVVTPDEYEPNIAYVSLDTFSHDDDETLFQLVYEIDGASDMFEDELSLYNIEVKIICDDPTKKDSEHKYIGDYDFDFDYSYDTEFYVNVPSSEDGVSVVDITAGDLHNYFEGFCNPAMFGLSEDNIKEFIEAAKNTEFGLSIEVTNFGI